MVLLTPDEIVYVIALYDDVKFPFNEAIFKSDVVHPVIVYGMTVPGFNEEKNLAVNDNGVGRLNITTFGYRKLNNGSKLYLAACFMCNVNDPVSLKSAIFKFPPLYFKRANVVFSLFGFNPDEVTAYGEYDKSI